MNDPGMLMFELGRKIGCDRTTPCCNNCIRTKRECHGYGLRLVWPGQPNRRHRDVDARTHEPPIQSRLAPYYGAQFLNMTLKDVAEAREAVTGHMLVSRLQSRPNRGLSLHAPINEYDGMLLSYCKQIRRISELFHSPDDRCEHYIMHDLNNSDAKRLQLRAVTNGFI